ncbi:MAG: DUF5615 family PIN-like protein [Polyangiaceae bacterium]|nr:DUF5615 family PIN-like protein [Polyangiaceae bacterium]
MKPLEFPILTDENIDPELAERLKSAGRDVRSVHDEGLVGAPDVEILARAHSLGRVVLTHDSDFGGLAIQAGQPYVGIVYLRPGHIESSFVFEIIAALDSATVDLGRPFILVAERRGDAVRIRLRVEAER